MPSPHHNEWRRRAKESQRASDARREQQPERLLPASRYLCRALPYVVAAAILFYTLVVIGGCIALQSSP